MAQLVIPSFCKLELAFPDAVFELYRQMKSKDSLSFQALGSQDCIYNVNIKKLEGFVSQFQIESTDAETGVLELKEDSWCCELKAITSEAFLLPGSISSTSEDVKNVEDSKEDMAGLISTTESAELPLSNDEETRQEDTILAAIATTTTTGDLETELDLPKTEAANMENIIPDIMPLDGIVLEAPVEEEEGSSQNDDTVTSEILPVDEDKASEDMTQGNLLEIVREAVKFTEEDEESVKDNSEAFDGVEIVFGKNRKITINKGDETQIVREEVSMYQDKCVQSEVCELLETSDREVHNDSTTTSFNLDMTLTEAALAVDRAQDAIKELMEKRSTEKFVDPNSSLSKFPIVMEGNKYKCHICGLLLIKKHYLVAHMRYVHKVCVRDPLSRLKCPQCDLTFVRKNRLDEHIAHKHSDRKQHQCDISGCEMAFKTVYNLRDHKRIYHYHMLRYACDICGKSYENPNTAERHRHICASKDPEKYGKKSSDELRNPNWVPIDELFMREPLPKKCRKKNKEGKLKKESEILDKIQSQDEGATCMDEEYAVPRLPKEEENLKFMALNPDNNTWHSDVDPLSTDAGEHKHILTECETTGDVFNGKSPQKRRTEAPDQRMEEPVSKKIKQEGIDMESLRSSVKKEPLEKADLNHGLDKPDTPANNTPSTKAAQLPLKDLLRFIKKKEAASKKQQQAVKGGCKEAQNDRNTDAASKDGEQNLKTTCPSFSVTGMLNRHKVYQLTLEELRRRINGPETLNSVALMSFINKSEHWNKMAELKKHLTEIGFTVPRFTTITSSFTKLCEGEVSDIFSDLRELQQMYLKPVFVEKCLINKLLSSHHDSMDMALWLGYLRELLVAFQKVLYDHFEDFDQVTHCLAGYIFKHFLSLYEKVITEVATKFEKRQAFYEQLPEKSSQKTQEIENSSQEFEVPSYLSIKSTSYRVTLEELCRRSQLPEQMSLSMLQQYVHKTKDKLDLETECQGHGLILQRGNRTQVKSAFSLMSEGEAHKLCTDFELLFDDHVDLEDVMKAFVKVVSVETKKGQLVQMLQNSRHVMPPFEVALREQCRDFDLVTHGVAAMIAEFTWTSFVKVVDQATNFCTQS